MNHLLKKAALLILFSTVTACGDVTLGWPVSEIREAIIANMTKHGYEQVGGGMWIDLYFILRTPTGGSQSCTEQRFRFIMTPQVNGKVTITGFGICYSKPMNMVFDQSRMDGMIIDAFKK